MSFRLGLSPRLLSNPSSLLSISSRRIPSRPSPSHFHTRAFPSTSPSSSSRPRALAISRSTPRASQSGNARLYTLGLGLSFLAYQSLSPGRSAKCQAASPLSGLGNNRPRPEVGGGSPPPESQISAFQLGFGSVAGICTGVFIKKGLKAIAFLLGGAFILLQYLSSKSFISVDWSRLTSSYNSTFGTKLPTGEVRMPTVGGAWAWMVDFLTANFQLQPASPERATFLAGLFLGLRLG